MRKSYQELKKLEDACKILLEKDKIKTKDELEILIDTSEEIVLAKNVIDKKRDGKITKVNQGYLNKEIERCENCVFILATNGKIKTLNKKMSLLLGYKKEDFDRISVKSIFPLTEKETISKHRSDIDHLRSIFCDRKKYNLPPAETSVLDKKNKLIPFQVKAIELKNDKDELVNILFLLKDIRARKRKEDEVNKKRDELIKQIEKFGGLEIIEELKKDLKETKDHVESIIESSIDGIIVTDTSGFITRANQAFCKLIGYSTQELMGNHLAELSPLEGEEYLTTYGQKMETDKNYINHMREQVFRVFTEGEGHMEAYFVRKDKILVPIISSSYWITDKEGQRREGVSVVRDLTERKLFESKLNKANQELQEAKDYLENIIATTVDGIIITDPQGTITRVNKAMEKMLGYTQEELKGMHMSQLGMDGDEYLPSHRNMVKKLFMDGRVTEFEIMWKAKDGKLVSIEENCALLKDKEGEIIGGVVGVRDISERKKIQAIEMKNDFISNISHEFRTPLTLSIGPLEGLLRGEFGRIGNGIKDQIGLALRNNRRLLKLVNQLLEFSRLESKSDHLTYYKKDINQFLSAIVDAFTFLAKKKDIKLSLIAGKDIESVYIDPEKMERVLFNIIGNAFKFTPRGGNINIDVNKDRDGMEGDFIKISVKDTGIGIKEEDLSHIFERFQQVNGGSSRRYEGTGIGLSLAKELIELQGGKIKAESEYGRGSVFTMYLSLGKDHINDQHQIAEDKDEIIFTQKEIELSDLGYDEVKIREEKPTGEKPLILFIDDNPDVRRYVTGILSKEYEVITAEDGQKGLEQLRQYLPDLIISDIMMPEMDGYEFCKKVKSNPELRHIPLIFLTAKADTEFKIESLEKGADDYIVKPFNSLELLARVKSLLRIQELTRENMVKGKKITELTEILHEKYHYNNLIGKSKPMQEIYRFLETIKGTESPVLISGETGMGKELVAHAIHYNSKRKNHPFIIMNCSALNKNLLESELFGHIKGAFTDAVADKKGIFELADGGTLFLDEIGEMSLATQVKLLRALEEGTFRPVGSSEEKKVNIRIIAATNKDLKILLNKGIFREDLYYRINVININLPPLRERKEDIPFLVEHFIKELNGNNGIKRKVSEKALSQLVEYSYPGNVRELKNIIERVSLLCESDTISTNDLPLEVRRDARGNHFLSNDSWQGITLDEITKCTEMKAILQTLKQVKGNKLKAAKQLNISRSTLYTKIEEYQIEC